MIILTTTVANEVQAKQLGEYVLSAQLAACVQHTSIASQYCWNGQLEIAYEIQLTMKTRKALIQRLMERVQAQHPYDVPEMVVQTCEHVSAAYRAWVYEVTEAAMGASEHE